MTTHLLKLCEDGCNYVDKGPYLRRLEEKVCNPFDILQVFGHRRFGPCGLERPGRRRSWSRRCSRVAW